MSALDWIAVGLLGGCAALARVSLDITVAARLASVLSGPGPRLAAGTFVVNLSGAFMLGLVNGLGISGEAATLIGTASLGAYTTFSTWMLQTLSLRADGFRRAAAANVALSLLLGFGALAGGHALGVAL